MIYRLLPFLLTFVARRISKSQKAKRATQTSARRTTRKRR